MPGARRVLNSILDTGVKLAFIAAGAALVYAVLFRGAPPVTVRTDGSGVTNRGRGEPPVPTESLSLEGMRLKGNEAARVVFLEYGDYQCPYCARFARDTQPLIEEKYVRRGKVRLGYLHLPLPKHPLAPKAAEAAECAGVQGKFWQMHGRLFERSPKLSEADLLVHANDLHLDTAAFAECLTGQMAGKVLADSAMAKQHMVTGTPAFFVGAVRADGTVRLLRRLSGAQPVAAFEAVLDELVAAAEKAPPVRYSSIVTFDRMKTCQHERKDP